MGKKIKLNLEDLKVSSFVTTLRNDEKVILNGGVSGTECSRQWCDSIPAYECGPEETAEIGCSGGGTFQGLCTGLNCSIQSICQ